MPTENSRHLTTENIAKIFGVLPKRSMIVIVGVLGGRLIFIFGLSSFSLALLAQAPLISRLGSTILSTIGDINFRINRLPRLRIWKISDLN